MKFMVSNEDLKIDDFNEWFNDIINRAELADLRYNVKGLIVYRPWSTFSMNIMFRMFEDKFNETGHNQVIMPTLIPEENFKKETEHVEGFTPEVFWVTEHGSEQFEQKLALRPTSETAFYYMFKYWLKSYRDLPFKTYQRANIFRFDTKATKPFFRGREFYFFESHNLFETYEDSEEQILEDMQISNDIINNKLGIPFLFIKRPQWDKFPGARYTFAADTIMPNSKFTQVATTHLLGQSFTEAFDVSFKDKDEELKIPYGTCFGPGITRMYGAMIGIHGDKRGLRLPFDLSPIQIIIVPIYFSDVDIIHIEKLCLDIAEDLDKLGYRVKIDDHREKTPKERFTFYEMKGVPIRLEIGPKDMEDGTVTIFRRDLNTKKAVFISEVFDEIKNIKEEFTDNLRQQATDSFEEKIMTVYTYDGLKQVLEEDKVARVPLCSIDIDGKGCADEIKADCKGAEVKGTRVDIEEKPDEDAICVVCGRKAKEIVYVGKSY